MYLVTVFGNLFIILVISSDSHLHTLMYFFLSNLSLVDICFTSTTVPKMLVNIQTQSKVITYEGCITQIELQSPSSPIQEIGLSHGDLPFRVPKQALELQPLIFGLFLSMYLITMFGNLLIILAVSSDSHLHTPMYFFLSNLSLIDICFTSTTVPKMLWNIQTQSKAITYEGCITQIYFYILFAVLDNFILTVMAYDRYVAICHPLHYLVIMNPRLCGLLILVCWILILGVYLSSVASQSSHSSATASVMYTVVTPMLNPFIYSLRNNDIKRALERFFGR
ncbi:hypothetical protein QTO34_015447 [Cnephaeus nilssonii]|uniref:Olfactory receptor n=1 Tax=Cnephaeus nilssonii TaxID=3371016 RepID=A0AA40I4W4_CNENI|nr:hypothetical protein QTO34_015447 [Eptesicus nilssonii]